MTTTRQQNEAKLLNEHQGPQNRTIETLLNTHRRQWGFELLSPANESIDSFTEISISTEYSAMVDIQTSRRFNQSIKINKMRMSDNSQNGYMNSTQ